MNTLKITLLAALVLLAGCDRKKDPILSRPGAATTAVSLQCPQYDSRTFPEGRVFVLVTDQNNQAVTDFKIGNFSIIDNGNPSVVTGVNKLDTASQPLSVVICLDRSGSMGGAPTDAANAAAKQFVDSIGPGDTIEVVEFASSSTVRIGFTGDKARLKEAIDTPSMTGMTALYDAVGMAAQEIAGRPGRKFIIVLTDGNENASTLFTTKEGAATEVNKAGVAGYVIGLGSGIDRDSLEYLASATNGRCLLSPTPAQLSAQFSYIFYLMQNLTVINYRSRENKSVGEITVFLNYGDFTTSTVRRYGA